MHAETIEARDFYLRVLPEFEVSPTDELHLLLLMKDICPNPGLTQNVGHASSRSVVIERTDARVADGYDVADV